VNLCLFMELWLLCCQSLLSDSVAMYGRSVMNSTELAYAKQVLHIVKSMLLISCRLYLKGRLNYVPGNSSVDVVGLID